ncbi:MAG: CHAT domain-containing protein [Candidatus Helarchaeota archaeon]
MKISCSNGCVYVERGRFTRIEETWYGDQFKIDEKLSFLKDSNKEEELKFENEQVEARVKTIKYHWPESDRIGLREGYVYDKTLRAYISKKKLVDVAEIAYSLADGTQIKRNVEVFFLKKTQFSIFGMNTVIKVEGGKKGTHGILRWVFNPQTTANFIKKGFKYTSCPEKIVGQELNNDSVWFADAHQKITNMGQLLASTTYQNNRMKIIEISIPQKENFPEKIEILSQTIKDTTMWKAQKRVYPILQFQIDRSSGESIEFIIEMRFIFIPERKMNNICFIVPESIEYWPCALACAITPGEKREHFSTLDFPSRKLNVFNPIMWYKEGQPLDSTIYDYLFSLRELDKICLFGIPRIEDIQQLIIMLLDRGTELTELSFYIFTKEEDFQRLQARKEEIAREVIRSSEGADPGMIEIITNMIQIHAIHDLKNAPLEFRKIFYQKEIISRYDRPVSEYLIVAPEDPRIAAIITPLARNLQCPVVLYSENETELENSELVQEMKGANPLAIIFYSETLPNMAKQLEELGYVQEPLKYADEFDLAIKVAQILEVNKAFNLDFEGRLQSKRALKGQETTPLLSLIMKLDSTIAEKYKHFLKQNLNGEKIDQQAYLKMVISFSMKYFERFIKAYYEQWGHLEEIVFNSIILCETMEGDEVQQRCNLIMAGNFAFYKNGPVILINSSTADFETYCKKRIAAINETIANGANPETPIKEFGKTIHATLIPPQIDTFLKILIPTSIPFFTVRGGIPLELIYDGNNFWSLKYGFGRMSGLDHFSTALQCNLSVSIMPIPKEQLKILIIANPTLDLPDASKELVQLHQRLKGFEIEAIEGWDAREQEVIQRINRGPNIIHYSGHGYMDPMLPLRSGLILTDSRLTALEISHLKLWSTPLIFTNACLSATLGTAFLRAGSCFFVSPLWSVSDFAALEYAYTFYSSIISGWALGEAQKIAKNLVFNLLSGTENYASDYTWLAYSCIGDPLYSLIYIKPWEKQVFGEIILAWHFVKQKNVRCARDKVIKKVCEKIFQKIKQLAAMSKDKAFENIITTLEPIISSIISATEDNWQSNMDSLLKHLEELDALAKDIDDLNIQDRVRQLFQMLFIAAKI